MKIPVKKLPVDPLLGLEGTIITSPYLSSLLYPSNSSLLMINSLNGDLCLYLSQVFFHYWNVVCHEVLGFKSLPRPTMSLSALSTGIPLFLDIKRPF